MHPIELIKTVGLSSLSASYFPLYSHCLRSSDLNIMPGQLFACFCLHFDLN